MRQKLIELQEEIQESTILGGDLDTPLSVIGNSGSQHISEDIAELNTTMNQLVLINIVRILHPAIADDIFFQNSHGACTKIDQILDYKTGLNKLEEY